MRSGPAEESGGGRAPAGGRRAVESIQVGPCRLLPGSAWRKERHAPEQRRPLPVGVLDDLVAQPRVTVRSGHGVGKSAVCGWATLWWLTTRPLSRVVVVAPEFSRQVRSVLCGEIRKWWRRSKVELPVKVLANRVLVEGFGEEWSAIGLPATEPHRIEGFHSEAGVLLILDETKGIGQDVSDALQGALTGLEENRLLVSSTPGGTLGPFYRIWARDATPGPAAPSRRRTVRSSHPGGFRTADVSGASGRRCGRRGSRASWRTPARGCFSRSTCWRQK